VVGDEFDGFSWDQAKNDRNYRERGLDFETAAAVFEDPYYLEQDDLRKEYGERLELPTRTKESIWQLPGRLLKWRSFRTKMWAGAAVALIGIACAP
jgi:hypothetical protein